MTQEKPLAPQLLEERAKSIFNIEMNPEEYIARYSHNFGCSSFDEYSYRDKLLEEWIYKMHTILYAALWGRGNTIKELRRKYLSKEEIKIIEQNEKQF